MKSKKLNKIIDKKTPDVTEEDYYNALCNLKYGNATNFFNALQKYYYAMEHRESLNLKDYRTISKEYKENKINKSSVIINTTKRRPTLILSKNISKPDLKKAINKIAIMNKAKPRTAVKRVSRVVKPAMKRKVVSKPIRRVVVKRSKK